MLRKGAVFRHRKLLHKVEIVSALPHKWFKLVVFQYMSESGSGLYDALPIEIFVKRYYPDNIYPLKK
jgi:hypothetical protein